MKPTVNIKIVNKSKHANPTYATEQSAGMDLHADLEHTIGIGPLQRALVPTNISIELPAGYEAQVRPRSGLALKKGITVLNTPGTIDSDYRGTIGVILVNLSNDKVFIEDGERIAQLVIAKHEKAEWLNAESLSDTERGVGGFGHTGTTEQLNNSNNIE